MIDCGERSLRYYLICFCILFLMLVSICSDFAGSFFELSAKLSFFEINVQNSKSVFELNLKYK